LCSTVTLGGIHLHFVLELNRQFPDSLLINSLLIFTVYQGKCLIFWILAGSTANIPGYSL
jgi:hypothetical protein